MNRMCVDCGKPSYKTFGRFGDQRLCDECYDRRLKLSIIERGKEVTKSADFESWDSGDMSELFWIHLGRYVKEPNQESIECMWLAYLWACHSSHGLSNSFRNAMRWAKIDLYAERDRWHK